MTGKQRATLRRMANVLKPILYVGKEGVTEGTVREALDALEARELIKGSVQQEAPVDAREAVTALCEKTGAEPIQCIGRRFVLYKPSREHPKIIIDEKSGAVRVDG